MSLFDIFVMIILGYCVISSLMKGIIKVIFSLLAYSCGYFSVYRYNQYMEAYINNYLNNAVGSKVLGFFILFFGVATIIKTLGGFIQKFMHETGDISLLDRGFGALLGGVIGFFIIIITIIPMELFPKFDNYITRNSISAPLLKEFASYFKQKIFSNKIITNGMKEIHWKDIKSSLFSKMGKLTLNTDESDDKKNLPNNDVPQDIYTDGSKKALNKIIQNIQKNNE